MKKCPKCSRSFDDSFSFCLEDGAVLSASSDQIKTERFVSDELREIPAKVEERKSQNGGKNFWKYALAAVLILAGGLLAAAFVVFNTLYKNNYAQNQKASNSDEQVSSNGTSKNGGFPSAMPTPASNPTTAANHNKPNSSANLNANSGNVSATVVNSQVPQNENAKGEALPKLKQGMSYAKARKMLIDGGWQAVINPPNRELYGQMDHLVNKLGYYEVEDCSGTGLGLCRFLFRNYNDKKLVVVTANNEEGVEGGPILTSWSFEKD